MKDKFLQLTQFWYEYVGCDHHKDRDCHFYVNKVWSYGHEPYYRIEHYGYMTELENNEQYATYDEAFKALHDWLEEEVVTTIKDWLARDPATFDTYDYNCKGVLAVCEKYKHLASPTERAVTKNEI